MQYQTGGPGGQGRPATERELDERTCLAMITDHWFRRWKDLWADFPDNYIVLDLETTGMQAGTDLITEVGLCAVEGRVLKVCQLVVLDWTQEPRVSQEWLRERIRTTLEYAQRDGHTLHLSYDRLGGHPFSVPPRDGLDYLHQWIKDARKRNEFIVGHNAWSFDNRFIVDHFKRWLGVDFQFGPNEFWDTGVLEKASQVDMLPWGGETFLAFCRRVCGRRLKGIYWNLSDHCVKKYGLAGKHGLDMSRAHTADFDATLAHHLFEEFRDMAEAYAAGTGPP